MPLFIGQLLNNNRYRIEQQIGKGGFGAVYRALDTVLKQPCAVKENIDTSPEAQRQFEREALLLARLRHSNLPRVIDHFFIPNQGQYLVMDFVDGQNLAQILAQRGGPLTEQEALGWIGQIGQALNYLHQQQPPIIHRDIKPQNIIVTPNWQAILVDFGISKVYDVKLATALSVRALTPGFAPPEQYGLSRTDARSDVYALGATLYTLLTNQYPPDGLERLVHDVPLAPPSQLNHQVSEQVEQAILKALEPTISHRLQSIDEFQRHLALASLPNVSTQSKKVDMAETVPEQLSDSTVDSFSASQVSSTTQQIPTKIEHSKTKRLLLILLKTMSILQLLAIPTAVIAIFEDVETILFSGPILTIIGIVVATLSYRNGIRIGTVFGGSMLAVSILCLGLIAGNDWGPGQAQEPIQWIALLCGIITLMLGIKTLSQID